MNDTRIHHLNRGYLGGDMDHRAALILALGIMCGSAHAGYAQATPPAAWSAGGGTGGSWTTGTAASNSASYSGGDVRTNASMNVGGRAVTMPASARFSANAARIAGAALFMNPYVRGAAAVATWLGAAGLVYDVASGLWKSPDSENSPVSDGFEYSMPYQNEWYSTKQAACDAILKKHYPTSISATAVAGYNRCWIQATSNSGNEQQLEARPAGSCPSGWYVTSAGCVQSPPPASVNQDQFVEKITQNPMPDNVPSEVPGRYPVELPRIDPTFIPTGNPQKNPSYDPDAPATEKNQPYIQPGVRVEPAPVASAPWQVSITPVDRPVPDSTPNPNPSPDTPAKQVGDEKKPDERDFCDKHPNVIACQELTEPEAPGDLPTKEVDLQLTPETGFAGAAVCPPPVVVHVGGHSISFSWAHLCNSLDILKPILLAFAWLSAAFILLGARSE